MYDLVNNENLNYVDNVTGRVVYLVVDPLGCQFVYGSAANSFLDSVSLPYGTATFVLLTFYWYAERLIFKTTALYSFNTF